MTWEIWLVVGIIGALVGGWIWGWRQETRQWNKGFCPCGGLWEHFDNSSQGWRGYTCRSCGSYMWITYPGIDKDLQIRKGAGR